MKKTAILFIIGLFTACSVTKDSKTSLNNRETASVFTIKKIENEKSFYTIYAVRNDSIFKIISRVDNTNVFDCEKIKVGDSYIFDLKIVFPSDSLFGKSVAPNLGIRGYSINDGKVIMLDKKSHNKIYTALNLNGLCIKY